MALTVPAYISNTPRYLGKLFDSSMVKTAFFQSIGGIGGVNSEFLTTKNIEFPVGVSYSLTAGSQPAISENSALAGQTITTYGTSQQTNLIQIFQRAASGSRYRERSSMRYSGVFDANEAPTHESEIAFQIEKNIEQMARDMNYTSLYGVYSNVGNSSGGGANKTRGIMESISASNTIDGTGITSTDEEILNAINGLAKKVYDVAPFERPTIFVNSTNKIKISNAYKAVGLVNVTLDRYVGGIAVNQIVTDFGSPIDVIVDNMMQNTDILLADLNYVSPVFSLDSESRDVILVKDLPTAGGYKFEIYSEFGLNHGADIFHGKIINFGV